MRTLDQIIAELPAERRAKIGERTRALILEEMALRHLRQALHLTQQNMAMLLRVDQGSISKIESRSDMLLSTLRSYVKAMGGDLRLVVKFPDGFVELSSLGQVLGDEKATKAAKRKRPELVHG